MLELLNGFVVELRNAGLPVSLTENLDASEHSMVQVVDPNHLEDVFVAATQERKAQRDGSP